MKPLLESQFGYCPLVWMCCNRNCNNRINHLHERALKIAYNDNVSSFEDLSKRDQSVSIYQRNILLLGIELYKTKNNIANHIMNELFEQRNILYNLWSPADFPTGSNNTVNNGLKNLRYLGPKINHLVLETKRKIKCWTPKNLSCKFRLNYIHHVFIPFFPDASFL